MTQTTAKLRNYTSVVPPAKSQAAIEQLLVQAGATTVSKFYHQETKRCEGFFFQLPAGPGLLSFKLPVNAELVYQDFVRRVRGLDSRKREQLRAQAERTAWRTLHEWTQIQLDMIAMKQVEPLQVLLPYQFDEATNTTLYERVMSGNVRLLN